MTTMNFDLNDGLDFETWLDVVSFKIERIFLMFGWTWFNTDPYTPTKEQIKEQIHSLMRNITEEKWAITECGRIRIEYDAEGELIILLDMDSFFFTDPKEIGRVDLLDSWVSENID